MKIILTTLLFLIFHQTQPMHMAENLRYGRERQWCVNMEYPPKVPLLMRAIAAAGLAHSFYSALAAGTLFRGQDRDTYDIGVVSSSIAELFGLFITSFFNEYCVGLLTSGFSEDLELRRGIYEYAMALALSDLVITSGLAIRYSSIIVNYCKDLRSLPVTVDPTDICGICKDRFVDPINPCSFSTMHIFCKGCIKKSFAQSDLCPLCRKPMIVSFPRNCGKIITLIKNLNGDYRAKLTIACGALFFFTYLHIQEQFRLFHLLNLPDNH